jgi:two-component system chemotaxis sensor kinase CheA
LLPAAEATALSDEQAVRLIFMPGFSTSTAVSETSGRGVGMDVVAQNVRRLRGSIDIETASGQGTTFVIQLPLTLAILQVLLVRAEEHLYALPLHAVRETLLLTPGAIQTMQQGEVVFIRNAALPVRRLRDWLGRGNSATRDEWPLGGIKPAVVVHLTRGDEVLIVDELMGKQQMVIKPLSPYLGAVPGADGTAILPDGSVTLILDVEQLAQAAKINSR